MMPVSLSVCACVCLARSSFLPMPLNGCLHTLTNHEVHKIWTDNVLPKLFLLEQLEVLECRSGVGKVFDIWWARPVLQIVEVGDEGGVA